jgi:hypothetical protein
MRRRWLLVALGIALVLAAWGTARGVDSGRHRAILKQAKARIAAGSPADVQWLRADLAADTGYLVREGVAEPKPLAGFPRRSGPP